MQVEYTIYIYKIIIDMHVCIYRYKLICNVDKIYGLSGQLLLQRLQPFFPAVSRQHS